MRAFIAYTLLFLSAFVLRAGNINFVAKTSHQEVALGQRFQITYTVNSNGGRFTPPPFEHFELSYGGGQSSSTQNINGKVTVTNSISYVLRATKLGEYDIQPAKLIIDGEEYLSNTLSINVVEGDPNGAAAQNSRQAERKSNAKELEDYLILEVKVDKTKAYVGEKITAVYTLYSQLPVSRIAAEKLPDLKGFWSENITDYESMRLRNEYINEVNYQVAEVQEIVLYPQRSGKLKIDPLEMMATAQVRTRRARSIWEQMMGGSYEMKELVIKSKGVDLEILPLPSNGKPENFSGAVGQFSVEYQLSKDSVQANEAIDFSIKIKGKGNLALIGPPQLNFPSDFETYDPEVKNNYKTTLAGTSGEKKFNYLIIPRHAGNFELEPYSFSYFDPVQKKYISVDRENTVIRVNKGSDSGTAVYNPNNKEEIKLLNEDIRHIKLLPGEWINTEKPFLGSIWNYVLYFLAVTIALLSYWYSKRLRAIKGNPVAFKKSKALKLAKKRLSLAKKELDQANINSFYETLAKAIYGYFGDRFNISQAEISEESVSAQIQNEEDKLSFKEIIESIEMARFAPSSDADAKALYDKSISLIAKIEEA